MNNRGFSLYYPKTFSDLVRIMGLNHSSGVGAFRNQVSKKNTNTIISSRDDVYDYLIEHHVSRKTSIEIMDDVRRGKGINDNYYSDIKHIDKSFIDICNSATYLFPRGHLISYLNYILDYVYLHNKYPVLFYKHYLNIYLDDFIKLKNNIISTDPKEVIKYIQYLENKEKDIIFIHEDYHILAAISQQLVIAKVCLLIIINGYDLNDIFSFK